MKKQNILLCAFIALIVFVASCDKSETDVDKFAALEAEKEQIMSFIKENNLENYSTLINTKLTTADRHEYISNIPANNNETNSDLMNKIKMSLEGNVPAENNIRLKSNEISQATMEVGEWPEFPYPMYYYGVSRTPNNIPYIDVIGRFVYNGMYQIHQGYKYAYNAKSITISTMFPNPSQGPDSPPSGRYEAWGDHWFSFGGGQAANVFSYDYMYLN